MPIKKEQKGCYNCNRWLPEKSRSWPYEEFPPNGVCVPINKYRNAKHCCSIWEEYKVPKKNSKPLTTSQKALWELHVYNRWSAKKLALLFKKDEIFIKNYIDRLKQEHRQELEDLHTRKTNKIITKAAFCMSPFFSQQIH